MGDDIHHHVDLQNKGTLGYYSESTIDSNNYREYIGEDYKLGYNQKVMESTFFLKNI